MPRWIVMPLLVGVVVHSVFAIGCKVRKPPPPPTAKAHAHPDHGPHGGTLIEWGDEEYHGEFTVDHEKKETVVYILDGSATKAPNLKLEDVTEMVVVLKNVSPPARIELKPDPQRTSDRGLAFVGTHEALGQEMEFRGELSGKVKGKPYVGDFAEKADHKHAHPGKP
ncbi:MAG: hypothetical protein NZM31_14330 [Gemmatales bacterium]|nr:hypothetical protein [Gemmatales bacterium]MDW8388173.1 hypothetical protein [Gemmatales bacterium]